MCSTASFGGNTCDSRDEATEMIKRKTQKRRDVCFKCKTGDPFVVIRHGDPFCGSCFDTHVIHKFRQGLGKTKILYPGEKLLVNISGNVSSLAMLRLLATGYDTASHKKITADPKIVVVDDSFMFDGGESPVPAILREVERVPDMPRQVFVVPFQLVFLGNFRDLCREFYLENQERKIVDFNEMKVDFEKLADSARTTFSNIETVSAREDIHRSLRLQLLSTLAEILSSTKIMMSDTSTDLAARLLTSVAVGRGANLPHETQYLDNRLPGVTFINCMREFTPKECAYYLRRLGVAPITVLTHSTLLDPIVGSVNRLTDTFISGLQASFPSTISTVMKTSAKLQAMSNCTRNCDVCLLPIVRRETDIVDEMSELDLEDKLCNGCVIALSESEQDVREIVPRSSNVKSILDEFLIG